MELTEEEKAYRTAISTIIEQIAEWRIEAYNTQTSIDYGKYLAYELVIDCLQFLLDDNVKGITKRG